MVAGTAGMVPADIGEWVEVGEPRVAPDGRAIAFVVTTVDLPGNRYRSRIWLAMADGSAGVRPVTADGGRHLHPRWAPDGRALAYVDVAEEDDDQPGGGSTGLWVVDDVAGAGPAREVATWPEAIEELAWSPAGDRLAFTARVRDESRYGHRRAKDQPPRRITNLFFRLDDVGWTVDRPRHLLVVAADGSSAPKVLTTGPYDDSGLSWSPDGTRLAFTAARQPDWDLSRAVDLFVVGADDEVADGADGPALMPLTGTDLAYSSPSWSPDGSAIAVGVADERTNPRHVQIATVGADGRGLRILTEGLDRQCAPHGAGREPVWEDGHIWFSIEDGGNVHVYRHSDGEGSVRMVAGERVVTSFDVAGGTVAFCASPPTALPELYVLGPDGVGEVQLTSFGAGFSAARELPAPQPFTAVSTGGAEVDAWIVPPAGCEAGRRYPTLLNIHGGPFTQYANRLFDEFQLEAGAGFAVVYCNPRGSSGSTESWGRAIRWPECEIDPGTGWGGVDHDDVMAVIEEAVRRFDFVDGDRLGVIGGSYGGYMTSWIVGHDQRFKAACSERAVNDLLHLEQDSDIASVFVDYVGVPFYDDPEPYRRQSPGTYVKDIHTPLLILHSESDLRCPPSQADGLFVALRLLRREVEMVRFPGEGHELSRSGSPRHRVQRAEVILDWFRRQL